MIQAIHALPDDSWQIHLVSLSNDLHDTDIFASVIRHKLDFNFLGSAPKLHPCETDFRFAWLVRTARCLQRLIGEIRPDVVHAWCRPSALLVGLAQTSSRFSLLSAPAHRSSSAPAYEYTELFVQPRLTPLLQSAMTSASRIFQQAFVPHEIVERSLQGSRFQGKIINRTNEIDESSPPELLTKIFTSHLKEHSQQTKEFSRQELRKALGLPPSAKIAGAVAPLIPATRLKDLIWAADLLNVVRDDFYFVIWGRGAQRDRLRLFADQTEAGPHVYLIEPDSSQLPLISGIDYYWHSHLIEPLSFSILQAMADGIPVIAAHGAGTSEWIQHQQTGLSARLGGRDEFARWTKFLIEQPAAALQLASQGQQSVRRIFHNDPHHGQNAIRTIIPRSD